MTDIALDNKGIKLAASVYGPADGEPILFLHGMSLSRDTWDEIAEQLKARHLVWTLDFRGHGHSDRASSYELADYVSDAKTVLAEIGRPTIIVGHSLGGCVAGVLAQSGDANVRAVFLEDPPWYLGEPSEWEKSVFPKTFCDRQCSTGGMAAGESPAYGVSGIRFKRAIADGRDWQRSYRPTAFAKSCFVAAKTRRALLGRWKADGLSTCGYRDRTEVSMPGQGSSSRSQIWACAVAGT